MTMAYGHMLLIDDGFGCVYMLLIDDRFGCVCLTAINSAINQSSYGKEHKQAKANLPVGCWMKASELSCQSQ